MLSLPANKRKNQCIHLDTVHLTDQPSTQSSATLSKGLDTEGKLIHMH